MIFSDAIRRRPDLRSPVRIRFDPRSKEFDVSPSREVQIIRFFWSPLTASEDVKSKATCQEESERRGANLRGRRAAPGPQPVPRKTRRGASYPCLLYTSDAADEEDSV